MHFSTQSLPEEDLLQGQAVFLPFFAFFFCIVLADSVSEFCDWSASDLTVLLLLTGLAVGLVAGLASGLRIRVLCLGANRFDIGESDFLLLSDFCDMVLIDGRGNGGTRLARGTYTSDPHPT